MQLVYGYVLAIPFNRDIAGGAIPFPGNLYPIPPDNAVCGINNNGGRADIFKGDIIAEDIIGEENRTIQPDKCLTNDGDGGGVVLDTSINYTLWAYGKFIDDKSEFIYTDGVNTYTYDDGILTNTDNSTSPLSISELDIVGDVNFNHRIYDLTGKTTQEINDFFAGTNGQACLFNVGNQLDNPDFLYHQWLLDDDDVIAFDSGTDPNKINGTYFYDDTTVPFNGLHNTTRYPEIIHNHQNKFGYNKAAYFNGVDSNIEIHQPFDLNKDWFLDIYYNFTISDNPAWDGVVVIANGNIYSNGIAMLVSRIVISTEIVFYIPNPYIFNYIRLEHNVSNKEIKFYNNNTLIDTKIYTIDLPNGTETKFGIHRNSDFGKGFIHYFNFNNEIIDPLNGSTIGTPTNIDFDKINLPAPDVFGRDDLYKGTVKFNSTVRGGVVLDIATTGKLHFNDLTGVTIVSSIGTSTPTINGNDIDLTNGILEYLELSNGSIFYFNDNLIDSNTGNVITSTDTTFKAIPETPQSIIDSVNEDVIKTGVIPFGDDALFLLNGKIETISLVDYFIDATGNGRNFKITGYDWASRNINGFPYKTAATINAPVGDAILIAADVNNFLYDSSGVPNEIPVVSFFQDIDYEHKIFCKHSGQVLDVLTGVEMSEPFVKEIVMYNAVKSGADLTLCQSYFVVPAEDLTATWCSLSGDDITGDGSKANPYLTLAKANTEATTNVYIQTGVHDFGGAYIAPKNIIALGRVKFTNMPSSYAFLIGTATLKGLILDGLGATYPIYSNGGGNPIFEQLYINGYDMFIYGAAGDGSVTINNCVINMNAASTSKTIDSQKKTIILNSCYINDDTTTASIYNRYSGLSNINISHCLVDSTSPTFAYSLYDNDNFTVFDNNFISCKIIKAEVGSSYFSYTYNIGDVTYIRLGNSTLGRADVRYNEIEKLDANYFLGVGNADLNFTDNIIITKMGDAGGFFSSGPTIPIIIHIENNKFISYGDSTQMGVGVGVIGGEDLITGYFKNNYFVQRNATPSGTHGLQVYAQKGFDILYNYAEGIQLPYIYKGDAHDNTGAVCKYNIAVNGKITIKGENNTLVYGNTIINDSSYPYNPIDILLNPTFATANNNVIKNNILVTDGVEAIFLEQTGLTPIIDNNILFTNMDNVAKITTISYDWADWQGLGYDTNGYNQDPDLDSDYVPNIGSIAIGNGENLGTNYRIGLDSSTNWGSDGELPIVVTSEQPNDWNIGAYVNSENQKIIRPIINNLTASYLTGVEPRYIIAPKFIPLPTDILLKGKGFKNLPNTYLDMDAQDWDTYYSYLNNTLEDPSFNDVAKWVLGGTWAIASGVATRPAGLGTFDNLEPLVNPPATIDKYYRLDWVGENITVKYGGVEFTNGKLGQVTSTDGLLITETDSGVDANCSLIIVREVVAHIDYPNRLGNWVINGGGKNTTDWVDTDGNGLADDFHNYGSGSTYTIVTDTVYGRGQKIEHIGPDRSFMNTVDSPKGKGFFRIVYESSTSSILSNGINQSLPQTTEITTIIKDYTFNGNQVRFNDFTDDTRDLTVYVFEMYLYEPTNEVGFLPHNLYNHAAIEGNTQGYREIFENVQDFADRIIHENLYGWANPILEFREFATTYYRRRAYFKLENGVTTEAICYANKLTSEENIEVVKKGYHPDYDCNVPDSISLLQNPYMNCGRARWIHDDNYPARIYYLGNHIIRLETDSNFGSITPQFFRDGNTLPYDTYKVRINVVAFTGSVKSSFRLVNGTWTNNSITNIGIHEFYITGALMDLHIGADGDTAATLEVSEISLVVEAAPLNAVTFNGEYVYHNGQIVTY